MISSIMLPMIIMLHAAHNAAHHAANNAAHNAAHYATNNAAHNAVHHAAHNVVHHAALMSFCYFIMEFIYISTLAACYGVQLSKATRL